MLSLGKNTSLLIFEGKSICMYQRRQSPRQFHHLWIVLAIISDILLASCSTTPTTGAPTPTPHPAATSAPLPTLTSPSTARTIFLILMENHNWSDIKNSPSAPLWWLLRTSVRKMDGVDLACFIFSGAVAFTNEGIQEHFSSFYIHYAEAYTVHPLLQWEMTRRRFLASTLQTR
jgi:hypothetical protein